MQDKTCIVSVAFREPYLTHSKKQEAFIREMNPSIDILYYRDVLPMKGRIETENVVSHFQQSLYGFKPHAIQRAIDAGYTKVIWLDPSVLPTCNLSVLVESLDTNPMIVRTGDQRLKGMVNQKALDWVRVTPEQLEPLMHVGGTVYAFNFNDEKVMKVFKLWKEAEEAGIFGTQEDFMKNHWADEAVMALSMNNFGVEPYFEKNFTYLNQKEL